MKKTKLPSPNKAIIDAYQQLIRELDEHIEELTSSRLAGVLKCRPGCTDCCMQFSVLSLEAAIITESAAVTATSRPDVGNRCLLLQDGLCQVYEVRPVICRTQGLPLAYIDEEAGAIEVSACPLNFPEDYPLTQEDLLFMDEYNRRLAELNLEYCRANGLDPGNRIPLAELLP